MKATFTRSDCFLVMLACGMSACSPPPSRPAAEAGIVQVRAAVNVPQPWQGATAVPTSTTGVSTTICAAPAPKSSAIPAATGGWQQLPGTSLRASGLCPKNPDIQGREGCSGVIRDWAGGIADTRRNRLVFWGGGHHGYYGNELYALTLDTGQLSRLNSPSAVTPKVREVSVEMYDDGKPSARHTYGGLAYIEHADVLYSYGGAISGPGSGSQVTWTFEFQTMTWKNMDLTAKGGKPGARYAGNGAGLGAIADYDPVSKLVYTHSSYDFWSYDYVKNTYTLLNAWVPVQLNMNGAIDSKRGQFVMVGNAGQVAGQAKSGLQVISIAPGSSYAMVDRTAQAEATCRPLLKANAPGFVYDRDLDRFVGWPSFGNTVYLLHPETFTCTTTEFPGGPQDSAHTGPSTTNGTFGRFRYFPQAKRYLLINDWHLDAFSLTLPPAK